MVRSPYPEKNINLQRTSKVSYQTDSLHGQTDIVSLAHIGKQRAEVTDIDALP